MARIKTYVLDSSINAADKVIGTDGELGVNYGKTKNYSMSDLASYFSGGEGAAGASAYQIWLANGNTGTEQDFLNSLVGAAGTQGSTGPAGANGTNGTNGSDGTDGQDGAQGPAGADGTSITIQGTKETVGDLPASGSTGDLWIINTTGGGATAGDGYVWTEGGAWLNIGPLRGPQGIQGTAGVNGVDGTDGTDGVDGAQGSQGPQGIQGLQGVQGIPGQDGAAGEKFKPYINLTTKLCDASGATYTSLAYTVQNINSWYTMTVDGYKMTNFSIHIRLNIDAAAATFFAENNAICIKADWPDDIALAWDANGCFAAIDYETVTGDGMKPIQVSGRYQGNTKVIDIMVKTINLKTGVITPSELLSTTMIKDDTTYFDLKLQGHFVTT